MLPVRICPFNKNRFEALDNILKTIEKTYGRELNMGDLMHASDLILMEKTNCWILIRLLMLPKKP
ncbi:MAG: hypothetical protein Ct9H300mP29_9040 [Candidatus Neomarinimicrobiota bacterium]|nr:MAG: hypothetical protein Ct9H300mP29_9040 [Candidatus Neomarinimicrobiota bacterium]